MRENIDGTSQTSNFPAGVHLFLLTIAAVHGQGTERHRAGKTQYKLLWKHASGRPKRPGVSTK